MNKQIKDKIELAVATAARVTPDQREAIVGAVVDSLAPKNWTESSTIRYGLIAVVTGALAVILEGYHAVSGDAVNLEMLMGGVMGVITGVGAIKGRVNATQPVKGGSELS